MAHDVQPHLFIVLGGRGDLMHRKLLPALYRLHLRGELPAQFAILGAARGAVEDYPAWGLNALAAAGFTVDDKARRWCEEVLFYQSLAGGYEALARRVAEIEQAKGLTGNRAIYFSLPPEAFPEAIEGLGAVGLNRSSGWTRLVVEKPFGRDLPSAQELNELVHRYFSEDQIYRIDHYLGKETVQNLLVFRFGNPIFEHMWHRDRIERVEITVAEKLGLEGRAGYYDKVGALRDMIQNHLTQLLALTAMEVPAAFEADAIRSEKVKVLRSIRSIRPEDVVFGQYTRGVIDGEEVVGYREEEGVAPGSTTETYVGIRLFINNWRWQGVPFILRTGKHLPARRAEIVVTFRCPPVNLFPGMPDEPANQLVITIQPDEGFALSFKVKAPGSGFEAETQRLTFRYADVHGPLPEAYETLLEDVMRGDATLFVRADEVEAAWELYSPVLRAKPAPFPYPAGSWGPPEADRLLGEGVRWATR
jgi:glucose-6-phosphate 1-dehydrogenase